MITAEAVIFDRELIEERDYWLEKLSRESVAPSLVLHRSANDEGWDDPEIIEVALPEEVCQRLIKLSGGSSFLLYTALMSAFKICLHHYTGRETIVVGSPALKELEGCNALAIVDDIDERTTFRQLLSDVRQTLLEAYARQRYPLTSLIVELDATGRNVKCPFFDVILLLDDLHGDLPQLGCDIRILFNREFECITGAIEFDANIFSHQTIEQLRGLFVNVLRQTLEYPEKSLNELEILTGANRRKLLIEWNNTRTDGSDQPCIHRSFETQAQRYPDTVALILEDHQITYRELNERSNQLAHYLRTAGVGPETRVAICMERSLEMIIGILGVLKAGGAYLPLDPTYPTERLAYILEESQPVALLIQGEAEDNLPPTWAQVIRLDSDWGLIAEQASENPVGELFPENLAYMIYTSGSTGLPKGVLVSHAGISNLALAQNLHFQIGRSSRLLQFASPSFDASVSEIFTSLVSGASLVLPRSTDLLSGPALINLLRQEQITTVTLPPSLLSALEATTLPSMRTIVVAGEACSGQVVSAWGRSRRMINAYGPTEYTVCASMSEPLVEGVKPDIGGPMANTQIYLLDRRQQPVVIGASGELCLGGVGLARGYLNRADLTAERFIPNEYGEESGARLYRTGDVGRYLSDGRINYLGRLDDQVKIRGFRIELGEIEAALTGLPEIREAVVVVREATTGNKQLAAYLVLEPGLEPPVSTIRAKLKEKLAEYMIPSTLALLDSLPLTRNGKVDRTALTAPDRIRSVSNKEVAEPRTEAERLLSAIWAEVLGLEKVGIDENFFEIGGDSILAIQIIARANKAGLRLSPDQIFRRQTIAEMAEAAGSGPEIESEQGDVSGPAPLTPIQHWFFEQELPEPHHYNQTVLLEVSPTIEPHVFERAVRALVTHHDALRLRFSRGETGWAQFNAAVDESTPFEYLDLTGVPAPDRVPVMEEAIERLQSSLNLSEGPLLRVALFHLGEQFGARLLIAIHHLAVNGVSWRILIEDFEEACRQLDGRAIKDKDISLPSKTTSFKQWAEFLVERAGSEELSREREYWMAESRMRARSLPVDFPEGHNTLASAHRMTVSLSAEETEALLREVPKAYRTQIGDVLLTTLAQAFHKWTGDNVLFVDMESHGREAMAGPLDLSRTVGWFTAVYPMAVTLGDSVGIGEDLKSIKEQIRSVPNRGIGYGFMRYLSDDEPVREALRSAPQAEVSFNYLGQFDSILSTASVFKPAAESNGKGRSSRGKRRHQIEINAGITSGQLRATWTYSENIHRQDTIERLAEEFRRALVSLITHCRSGESLGYTPSDFPLTKLSQQEVNRLTGSYRGIADIYPLTPFQKGLLFHTLLTPDSRLYFTQLRCRINNALEIEAFEWSWRRVIERHPILRTAFVWEGLEEPLQVVHETVPLPWTVLDWRDLTHSEARRRLESFLKADQERGLSLSEAPLLRLAVLQYKDDDYEFVWSFHHLLLDGWALFLVVKEVFAFYDAFSRGEGPSIEDAPPFRNYIEWLQQQDSSGGEAYWKGAVQGIAAPTPLGDRNGAGQEEYADQKIKLSSQTTSTLQTLARQHGLTLNTLVQAAWALVLNLNSGQSDIVFGTTVSGRPAALDGVESIVGPFINTLPVRVRVQPEASLLSWLREIQSQQLEARRYEYTPLVQVQGWSDVPKGQPLFESLLLFENYPVDASVRKEGRKLRITEVSTFDRANYPLSVFVMPGEELSLRMLYDKRRFEDATISRMLGHLRATLEAMMNRYESRVLDLPLLPEPERDQLLFEWNATSRPYPSDCCIHQIFESQAETTPDRVAVIFDGQHLSYRELNSRANQLASHLRGLGIEAEQRVAVCLDRSLEMLIGIVAILKSGAAYVPIDPHYPLERVSYLLEDSRAPVIVTRKDLSEELPSHWAHTICLDSDWEEIAREGRQNPGCTTVFGNIAYIIYTSGSTGTPKGVLVTHRSLVNSTAARFDYYNPADKFALLSSFSFDSSVAGIFWTICQGGALLLPREGDQKDPLQVVNLISQERVSHLLTVPSYYTQLLAQAGPSDFESLDTVIIAGESWPKELVDRHLALNPHARIYNEYGPTEGTVWSSVYKAGIGEYRASVPIGFPIANVRVYLLDPHLKPVPVGAPGQLHLGGEGLARGYFNHPELTASKFVPDPFGARAGERLYCTGDLARYLPKGNIDFLGRIDQQVKIRGYRIELEEIEAVLMQFPAVCQAVVAVREDSPGARRLVAYIVTAEGDEPAAGQFRSFLEQRLPAYMVPSVFVCLETLPLTPNGKVDRRALPAPDQSRPRLESDFVEPGTELERSLAEIWTKVLQIDRIGLNDNFFELGLDSILSIQILSKAKERGLNLSLQQIFKHLTIGRLAQELSDQSVDAGSSWRTKPFDLVSEQDRLLLSDGVEDAYPLSMLQAGMIFHSEMSRDTAAYHSINSARLRGPLDLGALRTAAQRMIDRHVLFRTSFHLSGFSEPLQLVHRTAEAVMGVDDLRSLSTDEKEGALATWLEAEQLRHFDWVSPPLLRLHVHQWTDDEFQFTFTAHHGVIDGWSDSLFLTELFRLYLSFLHGWVEPPEPPPVSTFRDYIALERESLRSEECRRYWADNLADCTVTALPREPRHEGTPDQVPFHRLDLAVPDQVSDGLNELAASVGVPLKSVLLAAHLRIMSLLSGHDDVITGLATNGRCEATDGDRVIGLFLNTVPFRQELRGGRWNELIKQTFEHETELLPYRRYPLAQIQRDMSGQPLFETCFNYIHFHLFKSIQESREIEVLSTNAVAETNYPLITHFAVAPSSTGLRVALDCDLRELSLDQVERIGGYYLATLEAMVSAPNGYYETCSLLSAQERRQLISEWNETEAHFQLKSCLSELFEGQVRLSPSSIAVFCEGQSLTYAELNRRANRVARGLVDEGVGADSVVALLAERGLDLLTSILGVFKAGGAYLPLDPLHPEGRIHQVLRQSGARHVLTSSQLQSSLSRMLEGIPPSERPRLLVMEQLYLTDLPDADLPARSKTADLAYVIFTSGSTGLPKGAMIEQVGMINHLFAKISALGLSADDVVAQTASQCFDISVWQFLAALLVGGSVRIFKDDVAHDPLRLLDEVESHGITILETVPSLLTAILDETAVGELPRDLPRLRWMIPTGEALPPEVCRAWLKRYPHIPMLNAYGPTECSDDVTHHLICEPPGPGVKSVPIGRPLANTRIYIVDQWLSPVPRGVIGELCVGGVGVGRGYLNDEARTREVFIEDPFAASPGGRLYKTGDLARYLPDGSIEFHGRVDQQVKIRGFRIELEEIEAALRRHPEVREAVVLAREDRLGEKRLMGYVTRRQNEAPQEQARESHIREWQELYESVYAESAESAGDFNIAIWQSSYTGELIPADEMRIYLEETVARLRTLNPTRVLEVGCGTGLLLTRLAAGCESYVGLDFSAECLAQLKSYLSGRTDLQGVELRQGMAHELSFMCDESVDLVIINSVAQYFPDVDYLLEMLGEAARVICRGGHIFVGDVRSLPLLEACQASVQLYKAGEETPIEELRQRVVQGQRKEEELVLDARLFKELGKRWEKLGRVETLLKAGAYNNELSRFRYDVVLKSGDKEEVLAPERWVSWDDTGRWREEVEEALAREPELSVGVRGIRDGRVAEAVAAVRMLQGWESEVMDVAELRAACAEISGEDPNEVMCLARRLGAKLCWQGFGADGLYDVIFNPRWSEVEGLGEEPRAYYRQYGNVPTRSRGNGELGRALQDYLLESLPAYMAPAVIVEMEALPLTPNGKLDRKALPGPEPSQSLSGYVSPQTETEELLAGVWAGVLGIERVGIDDNFFEIGGHSLLAIQAISKIRQAFLIDLPLRTMFEQPTISGLSKHIDQMKRESACSTLPPAVPIAP